MLEIIKEWGTVTMLGLVFTGVSWIARTVYNQSRVLERLMKMNEVQTRTISCHSSVLRNVIRALRSHSYALREAGANGSTDRALSHVGHAEDDLNACLEETSKCSMSGEAIA